MVAHNYEQHHSCHSHCKQHGGQSQYPPAGTYRQKQRELNDRIMTPIALTIS